MDECTLPILADSAVLNDLVCSIAMMGKTFDKYSEDTHRIWIFPFANLVLRYERLLPRRQRELYRSGTAARYPPPPPLIPDCI